MRRKIRMALAALVTLALLAANACWAEPMPAMSALMRVE